MSVLQSFTSKAMGAGYSGQSVIPVTFSLLRTCRQVTVAAITAG
ncbi:MAG: hypothetical protein ABGX04_01680 [Myxococcales bacterium]